MNAIEKKEYDKIYYELKKDKKKEQAKTYREANKDKIQKYREDNREKLLLKSKTYHEANKEKRNQQAKEWREANKATAKDRKRKEHLQERYGLTIEECNLMLNKNSKCPICDKEFNSNVAKDRPCIDHCHQTGKIRGIICGTCNSGIGFFNDKPEIMLKAVEWLIVGTVVDVQ